MKEMVLSLEHDSNLANHIVNQLSSNYDLSSTHFVLAYSGGLDSSVLLDLLLKNTEQIKFSVVHVNHQLHSESYQNEEFCREVCSQRGINFSYIRVDVAALKKERPSESIEAIARDARFEALSEFMLEDCVLLTAHHVDDDIETFFLRLLRNSGGLGLSGIQLVRKKHIVNSNRLIQICSPLLNVTKQYLVNYAKENNLTYFTDPTNNKNSFDRNYLRNIIIPKFKDRWPGFHSSIRMSIAHLGHENKVLNDLLFDKYEEIIYAKDLYIAELLSIPKDQQILVLRLWLKKFVYYLPARTKLMELLKQLNNIKQDSSVQLQEKRYSLNYYSGLLYFTPGIESIDTANLELQEILNNQGDGFIYKISFPKGMGALEIHAKEKLTDITLGFRQGGEQLRPFVNAPTRKLKTFLNEKKILPWWRSRIPLIYLNKNLYSVADLWVNQDCLAVHKNKEIQVIWQNRPELFSRNNLK